MTSLEITVWLVTVSAVLVYSEYKCGVGSMQDYAPWLSFNGGLRFPQFNKEIYTDDPFVEYEESCDPDIVELSILCDGVQMDNGCHYCESSNKYVCRKKMDYNSSEPIINGTITSLIITDIATPDIITLPNEILSIWKLADSILSKKPPKSWTYTGCMSFKVDDDEHETYLITGELFSNENRDGMIISLDAINTDVLIRVTGDVYTNTTQDGLFLTGELYFNSEATDITINIYYNDDSLPLMTFNGTAVHGEESKKRYNINFDGQVSANDEFFKFNTTGNVITQKDFFFIHRDIVYPFVGAFRSSNAPGGVDIPDTALSNYSINHMVFANCEITDDFNLMVFKDILNLQSLTFKRSKVSSLTRAKELLEEMKSLRAVYFENSIFPDLTIGRPAFASLEMVSFKESGPLLLNKSTFEWLSNSKLKYMNLQNSNLQWDSGVSLEYLYVLFESVHSTLEYMDVSYSTIAGDHLKAMFKKLRLKRLSLAGLQLTTVPSDALENMENSLEYLSLRYNYFSKVVDSQMLEDISVLKFPSLPKLKELDMSNCAINLIEAGAFDSLTRLERLYLSHNSIVNIQDGWYKSYPSVTYLDMSYNTASITLLPIIKFEGKDYEDMSRFKYLEILDLSYSIFTEATWTLKGLTKSIIAISLCNSNIKYETYDMFNNLTKLQVLDLSHTLNNDVALTKLIRNLQGLKYLYLRENEISDYFFTNIQKNDNMKYPNLEYLSLRDNNLKVLDWDLYDSLPSLKILDVSHNSISRWNTSLSTFIKQLETLFINDNKIDILTPLMLNDLYDLKAIQFSNNPFVCDRFVCDLTNKSKEMDTNYFVCNKTEENDKRRTHFDQDEDDLKRYHSKFVFEADNTIYKRSIFDDLLDWGQDIINSILINDGTYHYGSNQDILLSIQYKLLHGIDDSSCDSMNNDTSHVLTYLDNCVWVQDWNVNNYQCYSKTNKTLFSFFNAPDVDCTVHKQPPPITEKYFDHSVIYIIIAVILFLVTLSGIIYWKWWYIRYFSILVKNATVLSFLDQEKEVLDYQFDVFVSYCQNDRTWVLDNLIPNLDRNNLKVCLHERDFQVGVSILENIIANLDKSKCIMLIISKSFIKSKWCQFEMHLAQHRLIETRRSQLILIFLDYIPRFKRPKTLQYLMVTKTYIEWPGDNSKDNDKRTFWNRVDRSLLHSYV